MGNQGSNATAWIVGGLVVGGVGCGLLVLVMFGLGAGFALLRSSPEPVVVEGPRPDAPAEPTEPTELPLCPEGGEDEIQLYVELTATRFALTATDGTRIEMLYEGDRYPFTDLRRRLSERRYQEPNRYDVSVTTEPGVPASVASRAVEVARDAGFSGALLCRQRTPVDDLLMGGAAPRPEDPGGTESGTIGLGNLGTIGGSGGSGYGRGAGGLGEDRGATPRIRTGSAEVRGSLSPEVIRRVVRRHINEVRFCYEQELSAHPDLEGRVNVAFVISPSGAVSEARVSSSTLGSATVESCITTAVQRWTFPAPEGGGVVAVTYPFVLMTGG